MQDSIENIKKRIKEKRNGYTSKDISSENSSYISRLFTRVLLAVICLLISVIYINYSNENLLAYKEEVLTKNFEFGKINALYTKIFGNVLPLDHVLDNITVPVFNETLTFKSSDPYKDGLKLNVATNYAIPVIESGIVVFVGDKEGYGNTVIIQGIDGVDIWYGNITSANVSLYDYVESKTLLGEAKEGTMYLVLQKDGKYISYEEYKK